MEDNAKCRKIPQNSSPERCKYVAVTKDIAMENLTIGCITETPWGSGLMLGRMKTWLENGYLNFDVSLAAVV